MAETKRKWVTYNVCCLSGSILLIVMAIFHGSGFNYIRKAITKSDSEGFLKEIIPVLFAHPSIHLIGLAAFGILVFFLKRNTKSILILLSVLISIDAVLAFYLGGLLPGILLLTATIFFSIASLKTK